MTKALVSSIILLLYSGFSYSQNISISTNKLNYKLKDTILLKISNTSPTVLYYAIGLEEKFENKWEELEPTLNQVGKVELISKISKSNIKNIKGVLPHYLKVTPQENIPLYIRFRLKSGPAIENLLATYTVPILVTLNY